MTEHSPKETVLTRLRRYAEQNKSEPWIPVKADELLALVECAEAAKQVRITVDYEDDCTCGQCTAMTKMCAAIAKLEAL